MSLSPAQPTSLERKVATKNFSNFFATGRGSLRSKPVETNPRPDVMSGEGGNKKNSTQCEQTKDKS